MADCAAEPDLFVGHRNLVTDFVFTDDGGYLIWFLREKPVFIDSRQDPYPPAFVLEAGVVETTGAYEETFARHHITCAFLPAASPVRPRLQQAGWWASFSDEKWAVLQAPGVL